MEQTLVLLKPCTIQRGLIGEITSRFERKGLILTGTKMIQLNDEILNEHYEHLKDKPFFQRIKNSMMASPVIAQSWMGIDAVAVVRSLVGKTNGREAAAGTIRGDYSISFQENIVHASDCAESAQIELNRFFKKSEIFEYKKSILPFLYANDEL